MLDLKKLLIPDAFFEFNLPPPPLRRLELLNQQGSLFEVKNFHLFPNSLKHLSVQFLELDLFNQYIEDQDGMMRGKTVIQTKLNVNVVKLYDSQVLPIFVNQLQVLEINKGHPLRREIFTHSIAQSKSIKDLKMNFDW